MENSVTLETSSTDEILELGQLYIEPCHREDEAMALFKEVLKRDPSHSGAKFWLSYCYAWYLMEYSEAISLLESIIESKTQDTAAALILLCYCKDCLEKISFLEKSELVERSIKIQPYWVNNHAALAWIYKREGQISKSIECLEKAISNIIEPDITWSLSRLLYETQVTGRSSTGHILKIELQEMLAE